MASDSGTIAAAVPGGEAAPGPDAEAAGAEDAEEAEGGKRKKPRWLPLESNPEILNGFLERVGVAGGWAFADVLGLDDESVLCVPQPVLAVCLLFPSKPIRKPRLEALEGQQESRRAPAETFYLIQHKEFGNACGTIAAIHAIGNLARSGALQLAPGSPAETFLLAAAGKSPEDVGRDLADASELHEISEAAASSARAQTRTPGRDDKVDGHFVVFLEVGGRLVELDGCMGFPLDHGPISPAGLLADAAQIIRADFMARAPGNPNFSVMALQQQGQAPELSWDVQVQALVAMGFAEMSAREALQATGGNVDAAIGLLV